MIIDWSYNNRFKVNDDRLWQQDDGESDVNNNDTVELIDLRHRSCQRPLLSCLTTSTTKKCQQQNQAYPQVRERFPRDSQKATSAYVTRLLSLTSGDNIHVQILNQGTDYEGLLNFSSTLLLFWVPWLLCADMSINVYRTRDLERIRNVAKVANSWRKMPDPLVVISDYHNQSSLLPLRNGACVDIFSSPSTIILSSAQNGTLPRQPSPLSLMSELTLLFAARSCFTHHLPAQNMHSSFAIALVFCQSPLPQPDPSDFLPWAQCFIGVEQHQLGIRLQPTNGWQSPMAAFACYLVRGIISPHSLHASLPPFS